MAVFRAGCSRAWEKVADGCAWRKSRTTEATPCQRVPPCSAHPCARAPGCSGARKVEDQKMKISVCCLPRVFKLQHKKKGESNCQASLTMLALQSLQCAFLSVFFLWDANFIL